MRRRKPWWIKTIDQVSPSAIVRLRSQSGQIGTSWLAQDFVSVLEKVGEKGRLARARSCGRTGSGSHMIIEPGKVRVGICCSGYTIKDIVILFPKFKEDDWSRVIRIIASDAAMTGALVSGDFSRHLLSELKSENIHLIPGSFDEIIPLCNCSDSQHPCIHIAVAWYLLAEALDENPWHLFTLCGLSRNEVISRVKECRGSPPGIPDTSPDIDNREYGVNGIPIPSSANPKEFFSFTGKTDTLPDIPDENIVINPVVLLGPAPFTSGGRNIADRIEDLYPVISSFAASLEREPDE